MISNTKESSKVISIPDIEIVLHRDGFPSLGEDYDVIKTDNKSGETKLTCADSEPLYKN